MKISPRSDLHIEVGNHPSRVAPDIVPDVHVLAGDIHSGTTGGEFIRGLLMTAPVVYVAGNHEFYNHKFPTMYAQLETLERSIRDDFSLPHPFYFLNKKTVVINGVRFIGATLWTDYDGGNAMSMLIAQRAMRDFDRIKRADGTRFQPIDAYNDFREALAYIRQALSEPFPGKTVVVTHHSPSFQSMAAEFKGDPANGSFHSNLDNLILEFAPALWIHGHTHYAFDYMIDKTRVVCNPYGYPHESNIRQIGWNKNKIVEI